MNGKYSPRYEDHFPKLARGHAGKNCPACRTGGSAGHTGGNRDAWEESVGIRKATSKATKRAARVANNPKAAANPKGR